MSETLDKPITNLGGVDVVKINKGLEAFNSKREELTELVKAADGLEITSVDDRAGINQVSTLRKKLKAERVAIEKQGKELRDPLTKLGKAISAKENELVAIIEPVEKSLQEKEDWVDKELERIAAELLQNRVNKLAEFPVDGFQIDIQLLKEMTDQQFERELNLIKRSWELQQQEKAEKEKRELAEAEQRKKDLEELEQLRKQKAESDRIIFEQQQKIKAERYKQRAKQLQEIGFTPIENRFENHDYSISIDELNNTDDTEWENFISNVLHEIEIRDKAKAEKAALEAKVKARTDQVVALGMKYVLQRGGFLYPDSDIFISSDDIENWDETLWVDAYDVLAHDVVQFRHERERQRLQEIEDQKAAAIQKALQDKQDADQREKDRKAEELAQASDKVKFQALYDQINSIVIPAFKSKKSQALGIRIEKLLAEAESLCAD